MHSFAKIFGKLLATRLAPELSKMISTSQSAFIKHRSIHDSFVYVRGVIKEAQFKNNPLIFLKLNFAKAFDSIHWEYLLEALQAFGFGEQWIKIIFLLLSSASSRVLLNGTPGKPFHHRRGLRQGDPLAPMLFILALEPLHRILTRAADDGILSTISHRADRMRTSFYADDAAIFLNPIEAEVKSVFEILSFFGRTSGLKINLSKCTIFPIRCDQLNQNQLAGNSGCRIGTLPCTYLGLPLSYRKPRKIDCQKYIDKIASKLKPWKGKLMSKKVRLALVNSVLTSSMTYFLTVFDPPIWMTKKIDKIRRSFL
jgi:hypothetical protein